MKGNFRLSDFLLTVFFLLLATFCIILFRHDLLQTISAQNKEPAGIVIIKKNIVQRRLGDRVLWDRLSNEAPVYLGDLIRVADISSALLDIENNSIDLDENTLVRITRSSDGEGLKIELSSGKVSVSSKAASKGISLELNGQTIKTKPGTVLSAAAGQKGMSVHVSSGTAQITDNRNNRSAPQGTPLRDTPSRDTQGREVSSGEKLSLDLNGKEIYEKAAVVTQPVPNARYLKNPNEPVSVNFEWNRINFLPEEKLRLEIAMDSNFKKIFRVNNGLDAQSRVRLENGQWYWRLSFENDVLSDGKITITDGSGPQLISPALNSRFSYLKEKPELIFRWEQIEDATSYILEASKSADFSSPQIRAQIASVNYSTSNLSDGTWYWRVMPVFPAAYTGNAVFSQPAFFRIEQSTPEQAAENTIIEKNNIEKWLASVTPSKENLPPDIPKELIPSKSIIEPKLEKKIDELAAEPKLEKKNEPVTPELRLLLPAQKAKIDGLTALRKQTVFTWECKGNVLRSRFALSRDPEPLKGRAVVEIQNPGRVIRLDRLGEGVWYWNVEARTADGFTISAPAAHQIQVLPIPLLEPPKNITPLARQRYGLEELKHLKNIVFEWRTVKGANAYIFSLYQQTENGRLQIIEATQSVKNNFVLNDLKVLENGTFIWNVEAVNMGKNGIIEQRGRIGEYVFILDFPPPEPVQIEDLGILYGN